MVSRNAVREKVKAEILDDARTLKDDFANGKVLFQSVGKRAAERYLLKLCDLARTLTRHLEEMPNEAWEALCFPFPDPSDLRSDLIKRVIRPASEAIQTIRDDPRPGRKGRRESSLPQWVTMRAADIYEKIAGKKPTRKEHTALVEELFSELELSANADHCVGSYRRKFV